MQNAVNSAAGLAIEHGAKSAYIFEIIAMVPW